MIHIPSLFRHVKQAVNFCSVKIPNVVYKFTSKIGPKIFNFKETVNSYVSSNPIDEQYPCSCGDMPSHFIDSSSGHVVTGNLEIINDSALRDLLLKGPGYREPVTINFSKVLVSLKEDIKHFVELWSNKEKVAQECFDEWIVGVMELAEKRVDHLRSKYKVVPYRSVFSRAASSKCLEDLKEKYVLVPVDKASKNISVICKRYYMKVLIDEVTKNPQTYDVCNQVPSNISSQQLEHLKSINNMSHDPSIVSLPYTYWIPKFHKPILKPRFIVSYANCSIKPLSSTLSRALTEVQNQIEKYSNMLTKCNGLNEYWVIKNSLSILERLRYLNNKRSGRNITTYDFTTLYTMLPHSEIVESMNSVIDLSFKSAKCSYIAVYSRSASFVNTPRSSTLVYDAELLKSSVKYLLDNSYFSLGDLCIRQTVGIPIGVDCAPAIANLTLYRYESKHVKSLSKSNYWRALKFRGCFRLMDDITCVNLGNVFDEDVIKIYPASLQLNKENIGDRVADVLDLHIELNPNTKLYDYKLFDKRDKFKFKIVNYPDLSGNISTTCAYGVYTSELLRYSKLSSNFSDFNFRSSLLKNKLSNQSYDMAKLNKLYHKLMPRIMENLNS